MQWSDKQSRSWLNDKAIELKSVDESVEDFINLLKHDCEEIMRKMRFTEWL